VFTIVANLSKIMHKRRTLAVIVIDVFQMSDPKNKLGFSFSKKFVAWNVANWVSFCSAVIFDKLFNVQ